MLYNCHHFLSCLQQIWLDWQKLFVTFFTFVKVEECGSIQTLEQLSNLKFHMWKHDVLCAFKIIMPEVSGYNAFNVFLDKNSVLYTVTNIYWKARILLKVILEFCSENCALFMVTSIHSIWTSTKNKNFETRWKVTEDSRLRKREIELIRKKL